MNNKKKDGNPTNLFSSNVLKKLVTTGLDAAVKTEDAVKEALTDISSPKDILNTIMHHARGTKEDIVNSLTQGIENRLKKIDIREELVNILDNYDLEFEGKIRFRKKDKKEDEKMSNSTINKDNEDDNDSDNDNDNYRANGNDHITAEENKTPKANKVTKTTNSEKA